jgi:glycosyltransferase involved in cell wall biosynthesis
VGWFPSCTNSARARLHAAVLVIGGTRQLLRLNQVRRSSPGKARVRVVQRLDGLNWIHRVRPISIQHSLRAEYGNLLLALIRRSLADGIVYQSEFSRDWWNRRYGKVDKPSRVIHNGVDLNKYSPGAGRPVDIYRLLVVEGRLGNGYEDGLGNAVRLAEGLAKSGWPMEVQVVGEVSDALKTAWMAKSTVPLRWSGLVKTEEIPALDRSAHLLFSADVHPACPNSVIEALACGLPVVSFDTGSLSELVSPEEGFIGPYGSDSWRLEPPQVAGLVDGAANVLTNWPRFSLAARQRAEKMFGLEKMVDRYLEALLG